MKKRRKAEFKAAKAYFTELRPLLLLDHYLLIFDRTPPDDPECAAHVSVMETRNVATIRLGEGYYAGTARQRRHYAVHELLHIHLARHDYAVGDFKRVIDDTSWSLIYTNIARHLELTIDGLADVIAPFLPLPPSGEERKP
jgi:hypothetical protein